MAKNLKIIAVDFDGTLCDNKYPEIGAPHFGLIDLLKKVREEHDNVRLILWTCRNGMQLEKAIEWCALHGLVFDTINDNIPDNITEYGGENTRKVYADIYVDDHAWPLTMFGYYIDEGAFGLE